MQKEMHVLQEFFLFMFMKVWFFRFSQSEYFLHANTVLSVSEREREEVRQCIR